LAYTLPPLPDPDGGRDGIALCRGWRSPAAYAADSPPPAVNAALSRPFWLIRKPRKTTVTTSLWIALAIAILFGAACVLGFRNVLRQSRELGRKIDYGKVHGWKDEGGSN